MKIGFFNVADLSESSTKEETRIGKEPSCLRCGLYRGCKNPKMVPHGEGHKKILLIGEAPGKNEDLEGEQFVGKAGKLLSGFLREEGISLNRDCWKFNAVNCWPGHGNPTPKDNKVKACRPKVLDAIKHLKPKVILLLGGTALKSVVGHFWKKDLGSITKWRGWTIPDPYIGAWICPTFHPSFVMREQGRESVAELIFRRDIRRALKKVSCPRPTEIYDPNKIVEILSTPKEIRMAIKEVIRKRKPTAFDYETTGLKPQEKGHEIVCCSMANEDRCFAFYCDSKQDPSIVECLREFLVSDVPKIASNMKFEAMWSRVLWKVRVRKWLNDTMLRSHVEDNRSGITSIKFQSYIRYGVRDYDSHIERFLKGKEKKNANSFNQIKQLLYSGALLRYCGMDSFLEFKVNQDQCNGSNNRN